MPPKRDALERLLEKVSYDRGCWMFTGHRLPKGYGQLGVAGQARLAHRVSYELLKGPIPARMHIDHLCRNPSCVNPEHMEPVSMAENLARGRGKGAATRRAKMEV